MRITAQIQLAGILNLCEASATKAVKGRAVRGLAVPAIAAGSARAEPSNGAPEHRKTHAAHITKRKDGERAGALASRVVGNKTVWIGCRRDLRNRGARSGRDNGMAAAVLARSNRSRFA
jgi:hypothetical protein